MRAALSLTSFATTIPGAGVVSALETPVNTPGGLITYNDSTSKANLAGGASFTGPISMEHSGSPVHNIRRLTTSGSSPAVSLNITAVSSINVIDGFGPIITFRIEDTEVLNNLIGSIGFLRAGDDGTGDFVVRPQVSNVAGEKFRIKSTGQAMFFGPATLPTYTVATVPDVVVNARGMIYVSNEAGGPTVAYSNGVNWKRVYDNANIS